MIIRASKPMQVSIRLKNSMLFPDVGDVLIPLAVSARGFPPVLRIETSPFKNITTLAQ